MSSPRSNALPARTRVLLASVTLLAASVAGCASTCAPVDVPTEVALGLVDEEVRTLPVLTSGETRVAGQEIPDSHGRMELRFDVHHPGLTNESRNFTSVNVHGLRLAIAIEGREIPLKVLKVEGPGGWLHVGGGRYDGTGRAGDHVTLWWAADHEQDLANIQLPEGRPYDATLSFGWSYETCELRARGDTAERFTDVVQATANAKTFAGAAPPTIEVTPTGVGLKANYSIASGLNVTIRGVEASAVRFGFTEVAVAGDVAASVPALDVGGQADATASVPTIGLVVFPKITTEVGGRPSVDAVPTTVLGIVSSGPTSDAYATSGLMLPAAFPPGDGVYVVTVRISYTANDPTLGAETDVFVYAVR